MAARGIAPRRDTATVKVLRAVVRSKRSKVCPCDFYGKVPGLSDDQVRGAFARLTHAGVLRALVTATAPRPRGKSGRPPVVRKVNIATARRVLRAAGA